jgi:hypothetical protein
MIVWRRNRLGLVLALLLAAMFAAGAPARGLVAADRCVPATDPSAAAVCIMKGQVGSCCCSATLAEAPTGPVVRRLHHCACSLQAPPPASPAVAEGVARGLSLDAVASLPAPASAPAPSISLWTHFTVAMGPPWHLCTRSLHSRAPPTLA